MTRAVSDTRQRRAPTPPFEPPEDALGLTERDLDYVVLYIQILDGSAAGVDWQTLARDVLKLDPAADAEPAKTIFDAFHARALWMTRVGYRLLAKLQN